MVLAGSKLYSCSYKIARKRCRDGTVYVAFMLSLPLVFLLFGTPSLHLFKKIFFENYLFTYILEGYLSGEEGVDPVEEEDTEVLYVRMYTIFSRCSGVSAEMGSPVLWLI